MAEFKLRKGFDIPLAGAAEKVLQVLDAPETVAVLPQEFRGVKPRLNVKSGDAVKIGTTLFTDKQNPDIRFVSPVSGTVSAINRGERRKITEIVLDNDKKNEAEKIGDWSLEAIAKMDRAEIIKHLLSGGLWPYIIQRPFSTIANPQDEPRDIFISGFNTAPLSAKVGFLLKDDLEYFQLGTDALQKLTNGKVHIGAPKKDNVFKGIKRVEKHVFSGPHPAGNVGVQVHHIDPIKRGELVWQVKPEAVALIGRFLSSGVFPNERIIAVAGSSLKNQKYFKMILGTPIASIVPKENVKDSDVRYILGDVLTGRKTSVNSYAGFYDTLITVIPEGDEKRKLLGYFLPGFKTLSFSKTFFSSLVPGKKSYALDTLLKGGERAFVMSASNYEQVMPMDILPVPLTKSILAEDFQDMEGLGILELDEEDVALCSYICLSKTDFGKILRNGLDMIQKEG